jgi:hypothetical protein
MSTEDFLAVGTISLGAVVGVVATTALLWAPRGETSSPVDGSVPIVVPEPEHRHPGLRGPVDFAIIRYELHSRGADVATAPEVPEPGGSR